MLLFLPLILSIAAAPACSDYVCVEILEKKDVFQFTLPEKRIRSIWQLGLVQGWTEQICSLLGLTEQETTGFTSNDERPCPIPRAQASPQDHAKRCQKHKHHIRNTPVLFQAGHHSSQ
ncbi:hypothetical protein DSO57_1033780 [Entomophthora muscae]|uniref:Uncharacterized protein n=1 Tax=Entomophthora muscae TaxID=34485 RepID=A0ACC2TBD5_9FUNG|nr:hypothetical protein DSO57_1033780 [Entomophthora muscae]